MECTKIRKLQCFLKDIYFPYIQCDDVPSQQTATPVEFQVNYTDLAEIAGGEVAITNLHSCRGTDFALQLRLKVIEEASSSSAWSKNLRQANACLKFIYFPIIEGKENMERILKEFELDGSSIKEFKRVSVRRLGRLLPDVRWGSLPLMEINQSSRGSKTQIARRCFHRVKCFIDTDAGFSPTPSKQQLLRFIKRGSKALFLSIIALYALYQGKIDVVKYSLTGSILSNLLLVFGTSLFCGGIANIRKEQLYDRVTKKFLVQKLASCLVTQVFEAFFGVVSIHVFLA